MGLEIRQAWELRAVPEARTISGIAVRYGDVAKLPFGRERFEAGAFRDLTDVRLDVQHDRGKIAARTGAGLEMTDGPDALRFSATLPKVRAADDLLAGVSAGLYRGASIAFQPVKHRWESGVLVHAEALLRAVSVVDSPAYPASTVSLRWQDCPPVVRPVAWWEL